MHTSDIDNTQLSTLTYSKLLFAGAISTGIKSSTFPETFCNYDLVMLRDNYTELMKNELDKPTEWSMKEHYQVYPAYGNNTIISSFWVENKQTNIMLLEHLEHFEVAKKAIANVTTDLPHRIDWIARIAKFKSNLLKEGFTESYKFKLIRWLLKLGNKNYKHIYIEGV